MMAFDWAEPETLKEAVSLLDPDDSAVRPVAGGTALMLMMKAGVFQPTRLVSLAKIEPHYSEVRVEKDGTLKVGAMATLSALEQSAAVAEHFPVITETLRTIWPFYLAAFAVLMIVTFVPALSLWLPALLR